MAKKDNSQFDKANQEKPKLQPLISVKTFKSLQDIKNGDSFEEALRKLYLLMWENISTDREQQEIDGLFEEEAELNKARQHQQILEALFSLKEDKRSRQQKRQEERKETKKAEEPKKVEQPKAEVKKPTAEKVEKPPTPKTEPTTPKSKAEIVPQKPAAPKPSAEPAVPKTPATSKVTDIGKAAVGATAIAGLGSASAKFESSGDPSTVSSGMMGKGEKDPGGISYGTYQFSSTMGVADDFVKKSEWKKDFDGLKAGTPEFGEKWKQLAKDPKEGKKFADAQHDYTKKTYYDPAASKAEKMGFKVSNPGVADAIWSLSVQHGHVQKVLDIAKKDMGGSVSDDPKKEIEALYQARNEYTEGKFSKRYESEVKVVLGKSTGQQLASASTENKDLKKPSAGGVTVINNTNNNIVKGGNQETVITNKPNDKPQLLQ